jgi:peptidoglycan/LPS O-acetylase OafA/YrhL
MGYFERLLKRLQHRVGIGEVMPGLDGVRALAILLVMGFHVHAFAGGPDVLLPGSVALTPWLDGGRHGVDLFFALSGFLLMLGWAKSYYQGAPRPRAKDFYRRRLLRIVPAYYVHLAVLFGVLAPVVHSFRYLLSSDGYLNVLAHPFFAQMWLPSTATGMGISGVLWTLTLEAQFYLILPLVAPFFLGKRMWVGLIAAFVLTQGWVYLAQHQLLTLALQVTDHTHPTWYDPITATPYPYPPFLIRMFLLSQLPAKAFHFALGMALATLYAGQHYRPHGQRLMETGLGAAVTAISLGLFLAVVGYSSKPDLGEGVVGPYWDLLVAAASGFLVWGAAHGNSFSCRVLGAPALRIVGLISYSLYLWHVPICFFVQRDFVPAGVEGIGVFYYLAGVCGLLSLLVAYLSYSYIERPFLNRAPTERGWGPVLLWLGARRAA